MMQARNERAGRRGPQALAVAVVLALMTALLGGLLPAAPAIAATAPAVGPVDPLNGFPSWFQDTGGARLVPCLQASDPNCVLAADTGFDPARPVTFPTNFPQEFFYSVVDSGRLDTRGCSGTKPGRISIHLALEGAFANGAVKSGDQMAFGRIRLVLTGGLCKSSTYTVRQPFGQMTFTTDANGALAKNQGTNDVGCIPASPTACDWPLVLNSAVAKSFLRWDPAVAPAAPAGYLGDAVTPHRITGATYTAPGEAAPANYFRVTGPSLNNPLQTDLFTVAGKLAGPLAAAPAAVDFGGQESGTTSGTKRVVVTNLDSTTRTPGAASVTGTAAGDFQVVQDGCVGVALARDATCSVDVAFSPSASGTRSAQLVLPHDGVRSPLSVALTGTGTGAADVAHAQVSLTAVDFGRQRIGTRGEVHPLRLASTGTAPLQVGTLSMSGSDAARFSIVDDRCSDQVVAPGSECTLGVVFAPTATGSATAVLRLPSNDPAGTASADLTGSGYGGVAAVSPTIEAGDGFPTWYQDEQSVRLAQCIDPTDPNCIVLAGGNYPGSGPVAFPDTFPDEFFYTVVDSDRLTTPGCQGTAPGRAMIRMAVEGAFGGGLPVPGDQMTFGRIRITATGGLCPDTEYTFVHPYGVERLTTDAAGSIKKNVGTEDVGCLAATPASLCDFKQALQSRVFESFLRWDPAFGPAAPAGYLGDAATLHRVTGSQFTPVGESAPANYFKIYQGDTLVAQTSLFSVMGKLAGPLVASPGSVEFPSTDTGSSASSTVTLRNEGTQDLTVSQLAVKGPAAADFSVDTGTDRCTGSVLSAGNTCTFDAVFTPSEVGTRAAEVAVTHSGLNSPMTVSLRGIGQAGAGQAALSAGPRTLSFADLKVGRSSVAQTVTVSNAGGSAPLTVDVPLLEGPGKQSFVITDNGCLQPVDPGQSCDLAVTFNPVTAGDHQADLSISSAVAQPRSVSVTLTGTGFSDTAAVAGAVRADGFPEWYQDENGVRVEPCVDAADPRCVVLGGSGFDPTLPVSFPTNYPPEFFYALADSSAVATPGCDGSTPGTALLRLALEGTFASSSAQDGQQIAFGRVRITVGSGLCPGQPYTFTTPYGDVTATADAGGGIDRKVGTTDIGCGAAPCDFGSALASPVAGGFLRWAPGIGQSAPAGYLGDGVSFHKVVGATHMVNGAPANYFAIADASGTEVGRTDQFLVSGKQATGLRGGEVTFPDQQVATTSAPRTVTFTNLARTAATVAAVEVAGADRAAFAVQSSTCTSAAVPSDGTCRVEVSFSPTAVAAYTAAVRLTSASGEVLGTGSVTGHGIDAATPRASVGPASLTFPAQRVSSSSPSLSVQVTNTGTAALVLGTPTFAGTNPGDFTAVPSAGCAAVGPGGSCTVAVTFRPGATGARSARLVISSNDPTGPKSVTVTGTGTSSVITLKSGTLALGKVRAGQRATKSMTLTNTGTASLSISSVGGSTGTGFTATRGTCTGVIAPGRSCSISVTFLASGAPGVRRDVIRFVSDAANAPGLAVTATVL